MIRVQAIGRTDVGRHRDANEDAFLVGDSSFAVADGMGGHLAGEVASATALGPIKDLDGRVFSDSLDATAALRDAVVAANREVVDKSAAAPSYRGMGTTLTAIMVEGRRAHIAHVGDSRAYLLRDGVFSQLTTDHTLVQRLIDEGRLTADEAAHHPQRSVITRAIGVEQDVDVDAMTLDLQPDDRLLLCSDGLTGPVSDEAIARLLAGTDLDRIPDDMIDAANDAGGPDNITTVVLAFEELPTAPAPRRGEDDPDPNMVLVRTREEDPEADWAGRLGHIGHMNPHPEASAAVHSTGRLRTVLMWIVIVALLVVAVFLGGRWLLGRSYFVGVDDDDQVAIFQGIPVDVGPLPLHWTYRTTTTTIDQVPSVVRDSIVAGEPATDAQDAERIIANFDTLRGTDATTDGSADTAGETARDSERDSSTATPGTDGVDPAVQPESPSPVTDDSGNTG